MVKMLLHLDATLIHSRDPTNGASLLHTVIRACMTCKQLPPQEQEGLEELLEFLLAKINVNITDNFGATPLHHSHLTHSSVRNSLLTAFAKLDHSKREASWGALPPFAKEQNSSQSFVSNA